MTFVVVTGSIGFLIGGFTGAALSIVIAFGAYIVLSGIAEWL